MPRRLPYMIFVFCMLQLQIVYGQSTTKSKVTKTKYNYKAPVVRGGKGKLVCAVFETSKFPYHGIGVKVGDPFAITYKFYPNKKFSFALDFGKSASRLYNRYFRQQFNTYAATDTFSNVEASLQYLTHKVKSDFVGEFKLMYHVDARKISPGLQAYIGAGWQWKTTHLQFDYLYNDGNPDPLEPDPFGRFDRQRFTMGPQFLAGIEYAYFQIPISAFMEVEYFTDVIVDPGWRRFEGGIGLRYIF